VVIATAALVGILSLPDVTIRTETRDRSAQPGVVTTNSLYIKGRNQRRESIVRLPNGAQTPNLPVEFTQCEQRRAVELNAVAHIYAYLSLGPRPASFATRLSARPIEQLVLWSRC
jgi:hypothetical protein